MMWHISCRFSDDDDFVAPREPGDKELSIPFRIHDGFPIYAASIIEVFDDFGLTPSIETTDLLNAAIAAYIADLRIPRDENEDGWTRQLVLHIAVTDIDKWMACTETFKELLSFLTGDEWMVSVRQLPDTSETRKQKVTKKPTFDTDTVSLFSGGLDSFIGAIDLLEGNHPIALVGHHGRGTGSTSSSQTNALKILQNQYGKEQTPFFKFWVAPPSRVSERSETTTRARSIVFFGLGVAVAHALGGAKLVVPENGFISLNVPLTNSRLGSFSTRTTHPYLISLWRQLLNGLGIGVNIELPYRFSTKGEMLARCANQAVLEAGLPKTVSCSHPSVSRFTQARDPNVQCGYCVPCLVRRAAVFFAGLDEHTVYDFDDLSLPLTPKRGLDLKVFKIALNRYESQEPLMKDILSAGKLPGSDEELAAYLGVYSRGIQEVRQFLEQYRTAHEVH